jgi:acylphosphatase
MDKRIHVFYSGDVQGVGFRFTSEDVASSLGLAGWVRNLGDHRVEVVAEGDEKDLRQFMARIDDIFKIYIRDTDVEWEEATGEFGGFDIRF